MNKQLYKNLLKNHPLLRPKQNPKVIKTNMEIMAKKASQEAIDNVRELEKKIGGKSKIADSMEKAKNKYDPSIYEKKEEFIWDLMAFGLDIDNGWYHLFDEMMNLIEKYNDNKDLTFEQVKEKYGGLSVYVYGENDKVWKIISNAQKLSYKICENCGRPGSPNNTGWITTLCQICRKAKNEHKRMPKLAPENEQYPIEKIRKELMKGVKNYKFEKIE